MPKCTVVVVDDEECRGINCIMCNRKLEPDAASSICSGCVIRAEHCYDLFDCFDSQSAPYKDVSPSSPQPCG